MSADQGQETNAPNRRAETRSGAETRISASTKRIFEALSSSRIVRDYEESFARATGLPLKLLPSDAAPAPIPFPAAQSPFCALLCEDAKGCALCAREHDRVQQRAATKHAPHYECCFAGMTDVAIPVIVDNEHVATLFAGQVFLEKPTRKHFHRVVQQLCKWGVEIDLASLREVYFHSRVIAAEEFEAMVRLLRIFARHLALYAGQCLLRQTDADPPAVADAKEFARQHSGENVEMRHAARHVHLSANYFCKTFKKTTGITFTQYLSRVRVEKAKVLLANFNKRVSDVAFDSGFESIPHFNRVFKRYAGMSPTQYRALLWSGESSLPAD